MLVTLVVGAVVSGLILASIAADSRILAEKAMISETRSRDLDSTARAVAAELQKATLDSRLRAAELETAQREQQTADELVQAAMAERTAAEQLVELADPGILRTLLNAGYSLSRSLMRLIASREARNSASRATCSTT